MKMVFIPGINGMGKTRGCELNLGYISHPDKFEKINLNSEDISSELADISKKTKKYFSQGEKVFFLGGDHSISFSLVRNFFREFGEKSRLLVFDAHPDLMEPMQEPTHEEWLRAIIEAGFSPENILIVGVRRRSRNIDKKELEFAREKGIRIIFPDEFGKMENEILNFASSGTLYISFDIDVFDSSLVSKTGYPERGGLGEEFFPFFKKISHLENFKFLDFVEMNLSIESLADRSMEFYNKILEGFEKQ